MNQMKRPWRMRVLLIALAVIVVLALGAIVSDGDTDPTRTATEQRVSTAPDAPAQTIDDARQAAAERRAQQAADQRRARREAAAQARSRR